MIFNKKLISTVFSILTILPISAPLVRASTKSTTSGTESQQTVSMPLSTQIVSTDIMDSESDRELNKILNGLRLIDFDTRCSIENEKFPYIECLTLRNYFRNIFKLLPASCELALNPKWEDAIKKRLVCMNKICFKLLQERLFALCYHLPKKYSEILSENPNIMPDWEHLLDFNRNLEDQRKITCTIIKSNASTDYLYFLNNELRMLSQLAEIMIIISSNTPTKELHKYIEHQLFLTNKKSLDELDPSSYIRVVVRGQREFLTFGIPDDFKSRK